MCKLLNTLNVLEFPDTFPLEGKHPIIARYIVWCVFFFKFQINFEEIFAEPEGTYSFGTIWGATYRVFTDTKLWCYKFLSALCGVPCALCWGLHFACLSFCQIWYYQPTIRSFSIQVKPCSRMFIIVLGAFVEPCLVALGKVFSSIRFHLIREWKHQTIM